MNLRLYIYFHPFFIATSAHNKKSTMMRGTGWTVIFFEELQFELTIFNPDGYIDYLVRLPNQLLDIQWQEPANFLQ